MSKGLNNFLILIKREREEFTRIGIFLVIFSFFAFYSLRLLNFPIIYAATPTPSPPSVTNSPEPQKGGGTITFSSNAQPGASGELIKLLICKSNSNFCVWGAQWGYRRAITISNSGSSALTNYQVNITLDTASLISAGKMRSDCGDIRFVDANGNLLNYWIESGCNSATLTRIWVKVPNIPTGTSTIYVYYGNSDAPSLSNGTNTFDGFDDFLTNTLSSYVQIDSGWIINTSPPGYLQTGSTIGQGFISKSASLPRGYALRALVYMNNSDAGIGFIWGTAGGSESSVSGYIASYYTSTTYSQLRRYSSGSYTTLASLPALSAGWYVLELRINSTAVTLIRGNTQDASVIDTTFSSLSGIGFRQKSTNSRAVDWWALRKYSYPEPTASIGTEVSLNPYDFVYNQSSAVSSNPSANYTCPSCTYSQNTYYGVAFSVNESVWTAFTVAKTFTCKMEASQSGSCSCSSNTECYNPCNNVNWGTYYDGYCYNTKCYDAVPGSVFGLTQSCLGGTLLNHETSLGRYANVNGRLYYCKGSDNSTSPYPFVFNLSPGSSVGNCKCNQNGSWNCPSGIIPIRGGRIKIV